MKKFDDGVNGPGGVRVDSDGQISLVAHLQALASYRQRLARAETKAKLALQMELDACQRRLHTFAALIRYRRELVRARSVCFGLAMRCDASGRPEEASWWDAAMTRLHAEMRETDVQIQEWLLAEAGWGDIPGAGYAGMPQ